MNVLVNAIDYKGYKAGTTSATAFYHTIDPRTDSRIAIVAYGATCSTTAGDNLTFMVDIGTVACTVGTAALSGATTVVLSADPAPNGAAIAANDYVCMQRDDGAYQFNTVSSWTASTLTMVVGTAFADSYAVGRKVWCLGVATDSNHQVKDLTTASTEYTDKSDSNWLFCGKEKWSPMIVMHANAGTTVGTINYVAIAYVDK